ncbi:IPT/TIG domain-containing protein [Spirillospora albida]|uniref:IPT/TIG domain-containing protein n=1 Tax=Spirillospora albida TaxID=58123 RepID=UPI0004C23AFA|nr:OmpA family protein [Spirillospora albida]
MTILARVPEAAIGRRPGILSAFRAPLRMIRARRAATAVIAMLTCLLAGLPVTATPVRADAVSACGAATVTVTRVSAPVLYLDLRPTPKINSAYAAYTITNTSGSAHADLWVSAGSFSGPQISLAAKETGLTRLGALAAGASANAYFYLTAAGESEVPETHTITVHTTRPDLAAGPLCATTMTLTAESDIDAAANKVTGASSAPAPPQLGGDVTVRLTGSTGTIGAAGIFSITPASYADWPANAYKLTGVRIQMTGGTTATYRDTLYLSGMAPRDTDYTATFTFQAVGVTGSATAITPMSHISSGTQVKHTSIDGTYTALPPLMPADNHTTLALTAGPAALPASGGTSTYSAEVTNNGAVPVTLDDVTVTLPAAPAALTYRAGSVAWNGAAAPAPVAVGRQRIFLGPFTVPAATSRSLTFDLDAPATSGLYETEATAHVTTLPIDTSTLTGDHQPARARLAVAGPPPVVTSIGPASGAEAGGTEVHVHGENFIGVTGAHFGAVPATAVTVLDSEHLVATAPAGTGVVEVTVTTPSGTSPTGTADPFAYTVPVSPPPAPGNLASTGVGTALQQRTATIPAGGSVALLDGTTPVVSLTVPGEGIYTLAPVTGVITFAPASGFSGTATGVVYRVGDAHGQTGTATYTPTVTKPAAPAPLARTSTGVGTAVQSTIVVFPAGGSVALLDGTTPVVSLTVPGEGVYTLTPVTGMITFAPVSGFSGTATGVVYRIGDVYGQTGQAAYVPTVTAPPATPIPSVPVAPEVTVDGDRVQVPCVLGSGRISQCAVTLETATGKHQVLGQGSIALDATHASTRVMVPVTLNATGKAMTRRLGGVVTRARATIRPLGSSRTVTAVTPTRLTAARQPITLRPVYFDTDSATVKPADVRYLKRLRAHLGDVRAVRCDGHTDSRSTRGYNRDLAQERARAVCRILGGGTRTIAVSWGETRKRASNATAAGRAENRRTDIRLLY